MITAKNSVNDAVENGKQQAIRASVVTVVCSKGKDRSCSALKKVI